MEAKNPTFKVGDQVVIHGSHMEGMDGAKAKFVGAYDTTAYAVTFTGQLAARKYRIISGSFRTDVRVGDKNRY
jgi:hypothetical protein